mgnify:CR=1 FL=1
MCSSDLKVLHLERLPTLCESREVGRMAQELIRWHVLDSEAVEELSRRPTVGFRGDDAVWSVLRPMFHHCSREGTAPAVVDVEAELSKLLGKSPHRGHDQVNALDVPSSGGDLAG